MPPSILFVISAKLADNSSMVVALWYKGLVITVPYSFIDQPETLHELPTTVALAMSTRGC